MAKKEKEMITEDYVSSEVAELLKEKGFNEICFALYNPNKELIRCGVMLNNTQVGRVEGSCSAPTLQMAMKWLREVHNICIFVDVKIGGEKYYVCISSTENGLSHDVLEDEVWDTFEDACEKSIKYCLENLI